MLATSYKLASCLGVAFPPLPWPSTTRNGCEVRTCSSGVAHLLLMGRRDVGVLVFVLYVGLEWIEGRVLDVPGHWFMTLLRCWFVTFDKGRERWYYGGTVPKGDMERYKRKIIITLQWWMSSQVVKYINTDKHILRFAKNNRTAARKAFCLIVICVSCSSVF